MFTFIKKIESPSGFVHDRLPALLQLNKRITTKTNEKLRTQTTFYPYFPEKHPILLQPTSEIER